MRTSDYCLTLAGVVLMSGCAIQQVGPPTPVEVHGEVIGITVIGAPEDASLPMTAGVIGVAGTLGTLLAIPIGIGAAVVPSPAVLLPYAAADETYGRIKCSNAIYTAFPALEQDFRVAIAREYAPTVLVEYLAQEARKRTSSTVIALTGMGEGSTTLASAIKPAASQGVKTLVAIENVQLRLYGMYTDSSDRSKGCDRWDLSLWLKVRAYEVATQEVRYSENYHFSCKQVSLEQLKARMAEPGVLSEDMAQCYTSIPAKVLDFEPNAPSYDRPKLILPH
jgi:hypothetical protein